MTLHNKGCTRNARSFSRDNHLFAFGCIELEVHVVCVNPCVKLVDVVLQCSKVSLA